jgi:hypothetical protein
MHCANEHHVVFLINPEVQPHLLPVQIRAERLRDHSLFHVSFTFDAHSNGHHSCHMSAECQPLGITPGLFKLAVNVEGMEIAANGSMMLMVCMLGATRTGFLESLNTS